MNQSGMTQLTASERWKEYNIRGHQDHFSDEHSGLRGQNVEKVSLRVDFTSVAARTG